MSEVRTCTDVRPEASLLDRTRVAIEETAENIAHVAEDFRYTIREGNAPAGVTSRDLQVADRQALAMFTGRKWDQGRRLTVSLKKPGTPGGASSSAVINEVARRFKLVDDLINLDIVYVEDWESADIRVAFFQGQGSWSYIGTDAKTIARSKPTMNFGWLNDGAEDAEFDRVCPHEFMHGVGCPHEHQQPNATFIQWNKPVVYKHYAGPPNRWSKEQTAHNLFELYDRTITQFTQFDPDSIMLYPIPEEFTLNDFAVGWNRAISPTDAAFLRAQYPKKDEPAKPVEPAKPALKVVTYSALKEVPAPVPDEMLVTRREGGKTKNIGYIYPTRR